MWISRRTDYATRALVALALEQDVRPVKIQELAERTDTPISVLEQVLPQLRSAGIVRSERGPSGGYRLNHAPGEITLERVVRILQGPLAPIACATRHAPEPCSMLAGCALHETWSDVRDATIAILERTTFADLAERSSGRWTDGETAVAAPTRRGVRAAADG
jgi:Rrf2 family transcriptional regulator, cysteine metabolism repressor